MPKVNMGFIGGSYLSRSRHVDMQECINMYPQIESTGMTAQPPSKNVKSLIGTPGLQTLSAPSTDGWVRGMHFTTDKKLYAVIGNAVFTISDSGAANFIGNVVPKNPIVGMADNGSQGHQVIIVDGSRAYIIDTRYNTLAGPIEGFPGGTHVQFKDGRFIVNKPGTGQIYWSDSPGYDGTLWADAEVATAESSPDDVLSIEKTNNELWIFGSNSYEIWDSSQNLTTGALTFSRIPNAIGDLGTAARYSPATLGNDIFWLGSSNRGYGVVWHNNGYQPERVSTHGIEFIISQMGRIDDAIGYCYQQEGHFFYVLSFPSANKTLCLDLTTGMWHERTHYEPDTGYTHRHRGQTCCFAFGKVLIGDKADSRIYYYDMEKYTDDGDPIVRVRTCPHIHNKMGRIYYNEFEVDMEKGAGLNTGQGSSPQAMLSWSNDGGFTFGKERWASIGLSGEYGARVSWHSLGSSRNRVFRFRISDPVKVVLINGWADMEAEED